MKKVANAETTAQKTLSPIGVQLSTIELAELSGRRHSHILRSVERMNKDLIAMSKPPAVASQYKDSTGRTLPSYNLTKYQCELLAMALSGEARIRVLDRLYELEQKTSHHTLSTLNFNYSEDIPMNFTAKDISTLGVKFYQAMSRIAEKLEEQQEYIEYLEK